MQHVRQSRHSTQEFRYLERVFYQEPQAHWYQQLGVEAAAAKRVMLICVLDSLSE